MLKRVEVKFEIPKMLNVNIINFMSSSKTSFLNSYKAASLLTNPKTKRQQSLMTSESDSSDLALSKFEELYPVITNIRKSFGAASISCEVLHEGKVVFLHGEGFADVEKNLKPDENTVYFHDPEISNRATLLDLCSHGTGLAPLDHIVCGFHDEFYNPGKEQVKIASHLLVCYDFRSRWLYNNTLLGIVSDVIAKVSGTTSDTVLENKIFKPLGMTRSCTKNENYPADGNFARGYAVLDDYSLHPLELPALNDGSLQAGAGYVRSSVRDMLTWEKAVMDAETETEQVDGNHPLASSSLSSNPLKQMQFIRYAHRPMTLEASEYENSYGLGWFRHMLPSSWLGSIGPNFALLPDPPVMNQDGPPRLTIAHYGEFNGFTTAFYTFPDSCSAIVVMANCTPSRGDPADLIAQALCQSLFDMQPHVDYESYAKSAAQTSSLIWPALVEEWVSNRVQHTKAAPLEEYIGSYANEGFSFTIDVYRLSESKVDSRPNPELLSFHINNLKKQCTKLQHYHYDAWTFIPHSRDDAIRKGMEGYMTLPLILLSFTRDDTEKIARID